MSRTNRAAEDLVDAAAVHAAREEIVQAIGPLAASPLDEEAATRMRRALERVESPAVRRAVRRLSQPAQACPPLVSVPWAADRSGAARQQAPPAAVGPRQVISCPAAGGAA